MKKTLALILCCILVLSFVACSKSDSDTPETTQTTAKEETHTKDDTDVKEKLRNELEDFNGIIYITQNGNLIFSQANGKDEKGNNLTLDSPMYLGSLSKQFCAAAVMKLKEQGRLSLEDTLDKYFPEYRNGKDITIKNLLSMRSGVPEMVNAVEGHSSDKTESENIAIIKDWIFSRPLDFEPDTSMAYSNTNYFLLGNIVEIVSGQHYKEYIRENIFEPLGMEHTGFIDEVKNNTFFSDGLTYDTFTAGEDAEGLTKGAGDIVSTASDMDKWMTALKSGKVISEESYTEMTSDHSPDYGAYYGYGLSGMIKDGFGHVGGIGNYVSVNYFNKQYDCNIFAVTTESQDDIPQLPVTIADILFHS